MALWMETGSEPKTQTESADLDAITALKESAALELKEKEEEEDGSCDYKLVPWLSWDQWNFVRKSLFSSSPENIATALRRISAWRSRGCLPITVEVTAAIIEVQQRDPFFREGSTNDALDSEEMLAMLYCMAIMRLVNGVVEKTRKKTEVSIGEAADAIGIPRMLIDIRHEGSHRDLPSLQLVRFASTKALDWLRSYYWEPQKNAIPFQRGGTSTVRKEIKSRLCELVYYLNIRQSQHSDPSLIKGRGVKRSELLCGGTKFFSHMAGKLRSSKSGSLKKQITKNLRNLVRLYSLFPSEVVFVLMEFILKAYDSSYGHVIESSDNSQGGDLPGNSKISMGKIDDWKLVITQLSSKEPELLLTMLKAVLEMIETQEAMKSKIGHNLSSSDYKADICQIEHLFSLVPWLIEKLKEVKHPERRGSATEIQVSTSETDVVPKATLTELIRKCLLVVAPGTNQLTVSALLLAQMIGNSFLVERLKKISMLSFTDFECINESSTCLDLERILLQQEDSITQAAEKLEFLKLHWMKDKMVNTEPSIVDTQMKKNTWTIAKSWNPCPIGMLPRALGSSGTLPILDRTVDCLKVQDFSERKENWELNQCSGKREACCDVELLENSSVTKKMRETVDGDGLDGQDDLTLGASRGRLMIDGSWRKVGEEELLAIESAIRILL